VLNYVRLNKKTLLKKLHCSNFASISLAEIEYCYVGSYCSNSPVERANASSMPVLRKFIVVKREERSARRSRIAHEKMILTKIKDGMSMFLPKYYINVERSSEDENELMADFLNYPTLADYVSKNIDSISYQTKIYLGYILAQSLRYLQEYHIAHLDLKPSNIMLCKKMMVKLIDFGESYHPDLKSNSFPTQTTTSPASPCPTLPPRTTPSPSTTPTRTISSRWA
jgi:serine/threonine protein kinase